MGKWYSSDLRERISAHVASGGTRRGAARLFGVSPSCAVKLAQRVAQTGSTAQRVRAALRAVANSRNIWPA